MWVQGVHFVTGNPTVAHHALLYVDQSGEAAQEVVADGQYPCFGGAGVGGSNLIAGWAPGGVPMELPADAGILLKKGALLVLQMHYHPLGPAAAEDRTTVQLKLASVAPKYDVVTMLHGNARNAAKGLLAGPADNGGIEFRIPAGATKHVETMQWQVPLTWAGKGVDYVHVYGVSTHMHYLGRDMKVWIERRSGDDADVGNCSNDDKSELQPCIQKSCAAAKGAQLSECAKKACGVELKAIAPTCLACLVKQASAGANIEAVWTSCMKTTTLAPGPAGSDVNTCLIQTPAYDFNWQRFYVYDAPIVELPALRPGDRVMMRCTYDNSTSNLTLAAALKEQGLDAPKDVVIGEQTLDEMCLAALYVLYPAKK